MALFQGNIGPMRDTKDQYFRSNTKLQAGTHDSPGEKFLVDPRLPRLFRYHFGGDGWVVIPKGRAVAPSTDNDGVIVNGQMKDFDTNAMTPVLTLANGGKDVQGLDKNGNTFTRKANRAIGVAYANLYEEIVDGFNGMQPTIENEIYIELPYIPLKANAEEIEWGSFYDVDPARPVKAGDYVMSDENGRLIKADFDKVREDMAAAKANIEAAKTAAANATDVAGLSQALQDLADAEAALADAQSEYTRLSEQVIGQVWAVETNLPPAGWLKWVGWSQEDIRSDQAAMATGFTPNDMGTQDGFPGYPFEKTYRNFDPKTNKYYPTGIPGLTNGSNIEVPFNDLVIGMVQPGQSGRYDFRIMQTPIVEGSLTLKVGDQELNPSEFVVDYQSGLVTLKNIDASGFASPQEVKATFKATGQIPGVPTGWDFKGSVGAVRILLQK